MGEKDLTEKALEAFPDVFADCVNVLLYHGEEVLKASNLQAAPTETIYPTGKDELHNQFQDISKYEVRECEIKAQYILENQTDIDKGMILRKAGYEGAIYRTQYNENSLYPVISMVLYWGYRRWNYPKSLRKMLQDKLVPKAMKYVDEVKLLVFEMAHLSSEKRRQFKSDMRIVVDYLAEGKDYIPSEQKIVHVEALLRLLRALTGDNRFVDIIWDNVKKSGKTEGRNMCELLDKYWNGGVEEGRVEGKAESISMIRGMYTHKMTGEAIARLINQKQEYINQIIALFIKYPEEDDLSIARRILFSDMDMRLPVV